MIDKEELKKFMTTINSDDTNKKEKIFNDIQVEEILFLKENKVLQKNIIEFLFQKYPDLKINYEERISTIKSLISKIKINQKPKKRRTNEKIENEVNSSTSSEVEEPKNKDSSILSKINDKKQERKSFLPSDYIDGKDELNKILNK